MKYELIQLKKSIETDVCNSVYKHYVSFFESLVRGREFADYEDYVIEYNPIKGNITRNKLIKWFNTTLENDEKKYGEIHPEIQIFDCIGTIKPVLKDMNYSKYISDKFVLEFDEDKHKYTGYIMFYNPNGNVNPVNKYIYVSEMNWCNEGPTFYIQDLIDCLTNAIFNYLIKV